MKNIYYEGGDVCRTYRSRESYRMEKSIGMRYAYGEICDLHEFHIFYNPWKKFQAAP